MHSSFRLGAVLGLAALGLAAMPAAQAQVTSAVYSGTFTEDDNVFLQTFDVGPDGAFVDLFTTSYGGGTNVDGSTTTAGGFDTELALFDPNGNLVGANDDGVDNGFNIPTDPATGAAYDAKLQVQLTPGIYTVAVTEFDNIANGPTFGDGFSEDGTGNFTGGNGFIDSTQSQRNNSYTLNIGTAPVPEASTTVSFGLLLVLGIGSVVMAAKKKKACSAV